jgi:hypothetical protein
MGWRALRARGIIESPLAAQRGVLRMTQGRAFPDRPFDGPVRGSPERPDSRTGFTEPLANMPTAQRAGQGSWQRKPARSRAAWRFKELRRIYASNGNAVVLNGGA